MSSAVRSENWGCGGQVCYFQPNQRVLSKNSTTQDFRITFKTNLACIFQSARANWSINVCYETPCKWFIRRWETRHFQIFLTINRIFSKETLSKTSSLDIKCNCILIINNVQLTVSNGTQIHFCVFFAVFTRCCYPLIPSCLFPFFCATPLCIHKFFSRASSITRPIQQSKQTLVLQMCSIL